MRRNVVKSGLAKVLLAVAWLLCTGGFALANAQTLTGQIGGARTDGQKAILPGVSITVRNTSTQVVREVVTDANGAFVVTSLLPGTYDITIKMSGFKTYEQKGLVLTATERLSLPPIAMAVGQFTEAVAV